jgi:multidrug efflux pump subunit AcrB
MNLTQATLDKRAISYFCTFLLIFGGLASYTSLGQLEDPEFTVKTAAITVMYPGASAEQVELEVIDLIESKLQEMTQLKNVYSMARPGQAIIKVDIQNQYWADRIPQVWDIMRSKIRDIEDQLPPGVGKPVIRDDFGFVFGFLIGVSGDGYTYADLDDWVKSIRKELQVVEDVARVDFWGQQARRVYLNVSETQLSQLGIRPSDITAALQQQNMVVNAGNLNFENQRLRMSVTGEFDSPEDIGALSIGASKVQESLQGISGNEIILLRDIAEIEAGYQDPPVTLMRMNGRPAIGLAAAPVSGVNVVEVGAAIDRRLEELQALLPIGIEVERISWQSDQISQSISDFMVSLIQAVVIVLVILAVTMGVRIGVIIGFSGLVFAILGTMIVMAIMGIDLHRVSLGAMVIAMGMMVDNAIVVADGIAVRLKQGMERNAAAVEAASLPSMPLLGATIVACMAFYPIFASDFDTGEYSGSLFTVVAISLLISWLLSQTITPLMCVMFLPDPKPADSGKDPYDTPLYRWFGGVLDVSMQNARVFMALMLVLLASAVYAYGYVRQLYFPDSSRTQIMIDYWMEEGTRIEDTSAAIAELEAALLEFEETDLVSTFIGAGPPRFYLPVSPESNYPAYGQLIVNTHNLPEVDTLIDKTNAWLEAHNDNALVRVRKYAVGAFDDWKFEARFAGPANADPAVLRDLAEQGMAILRASNHAKEIRTDWRTPSRELQLQYNENRGNFAGVDRTHVGATTRRAGDGVPIGLYREGDEQIPIIARSVNRTRDSAAIELDQLQVIMGNTTNTLPLAQVVDGSALVWRDNIIWRWDRKRAITVQAAPRNGTAPVLMDDVKEAFLAIPLPSGYTLEWGGEFDSQRQSMEALTPGFGPAGVIMLLIIVVLFNAFRPPLIIILVIPFVFIGISYGLLVTDTPFGFIALLGAMSLIGMMIKNAVVLLDEINLNVDRGIAGYTAVKQAAVSRLAPVMNAAATTVFGVVPLLSDVFWVGLAITIMFGLAFGTILTMVVVPVLYTIFYRLKPE